MTAPRKVTIPEGETRTTIKTPSTRTRSGPSLPAEKAVTRAATAAPRTRSVAATMKAPTRSGPSRSSRALPPGMAQRSVSAGKGLPKGIAKRNAPRGGLGLAIQGTPDGRSWPAGSKSGARSTRRNVAR